LLGAEEQELDQHGHQQDGDAEIADQAIEEVERQDIGLVMK